MHTVQFALSFQADCYRAGLTEDEMMEIVAAIALDPLAGDLIPGTGGARKLRFARRGEGKSGGYRTVSYFAGGDFPVLLLALIDKRSRSDLSQAQRNAIRKEVDGYASDKKRKTND